MSFVVVCGLENTCVMTETSGCIMGASYDFETQFVCGAMQAGNVPPIYDKATQGCCNQGQPYSLELEFCCANTLYPVGSGQCVRWLRSETEKYPECYQCTVNPNRALSYLDALGIADEITSAELATQRQLAASDQSAEENTDETAPETSHLRVSRNAVKELPQLEQTDTYTDRGDISDLTQTDHSQDMDMTNVDTTHNDEEGEGEVHRQLATWPTSVPFDTRANGPSPTPCLEMTDKEGCFNTYTYKFVTHYPCYDLLLTWSVYGCCDGIPYRHASQTCCYLDGEYVVKNANTWCTCQSYECAPSSAPTKKPVSPKPSQKPTRKPTPIPTLTYYPTVEPTHAPTAQPSISHKPTPSRAASSLDDDEFHVKYIYGGAGIIVVGMAALMYMQGRASRLIKQRHSVVQEIQDVY